MKTIEQCYKDFLNQLIPNDFSVKQISVTIENAFKSGINFAQQWIDVNDELPKEKTWVIAKVSNYYVAAYYNNEYWWDYHGTSKAIHNITHWRPI
jgi:hypothetical protein